MTPDDVVDRALEHCKNIVIALHTRQSNLLGVCWTVSSNLVFTLAVMELLDAVSFLLSNGLAAPKQSFFILYFANSSLSFSLQVKC